ncbi:MAG: cytochrome c4 [Hyphomicrobiales bacterium]|nr:cytochrome c4 [Hyphomicrobiales bacterium]MBV8419812.1 cytochrome c4 [Hyphomicrobiales bacterium]
MARDQGTFKLYNPWPKIGWGVAAAVLVVSVVLGFGLLSRYQQNAPTLDLWSAICRGLGITSDIGPATESEPTLRTSTRIAWTSSTLDQIAAGDAQHGAFIALNCTACHGQDGVSTSTLIPTLAGMDAAVIYKQLDDYRSGKRLWGVMGAIAKALSDQDSADVAAHFEAQTRGLPQLKGYRLPESGRSLRESDPAKRLVFAGDPQRGIPPCSACHGPGGYKLGASALHGQQAAYIERQLAAFAQGIRQNDIFEQMRVVARQLTPEEMQALAAFYGKLGEMQPAMVVGSQ